MAPTPSKAAEANDFQSFIQNARERKKNEDLASKIFSKSRRQSAPSHLKTAPVGGSLASRVGVKKQRASLGSKAAPPKPAGNINGEWTHDLHRTVNDDPRSLAARITTTTTTDNANGTTTTRNQRKNARRAAALDRMDVDPSLQQQVNIRSSSSFATLPPAAPLSRGISIRGLAGPFTVMAQNFAPGTTEADIESAMTPVGGEMESCRIIKTKPLLIAEMVFVSREGGERVIETFNDKKADGRLLKVYPKIGGGQSSASVTPASNDYIVDGSMGFPDPGQKHQLYSDRMIGGNAKKRGRGGQRGRGGR
ncbi:putative RNA-binding protein-like protein [Hapsidospora chrysogenum ATCC 11550]|uniref:Putative RNA-binding protein-like protein n=1 Tax=Hapsidospora chrysogenum (strain ATCC 11550 / CBS 779.69 / DSM 880 / IAM 14645 / JCM 23072 / IMI 49137) TaxID=857340 RepID=A0A086T482_HAPC1|nr:putative RNA-binding protein-like protein [Hapsidospora chrysogenum ATCC 11550]